jgi:hypothetical protein
MNNPKTLWNSQFTTFKSILLNPANFQEAIPLCLELHAMVHTSEMSGTGAKTFEDQLWDGLAETTFRTMPGAKDVTIAWNLWHLTRIEDVTMNLLIAGEPQVFNTGNWLEKLNVTVRDTGNAMTDAEIIDLSSKINMAGLRNYRIAVGRKTQAIVSKLQPADLKRRMAPANLQRIFDEGAVLPVEGSGWLVDFWGRKNVAGILLMPVTRHQMVHINDSLLLKAKCQSRRNKKRP